MDLSGIDYLTLENSKPASFDDMSPMKLAVSASNIYGPTKKLFGEK